MGPTFCTSKLPVNPYDQPSETNFFGVKFLQPGEFFFQETKNKIKKVGFRVFWCYFPQKKSEKKITTRPRYYLGCYVVVGFLKIYCPLKNS
jgi:hypothetical protein